LDSGLFVVSEAGDVIFNPHDSEVGAAVVAASTVVNEQASAAPIEFLTTALFTDLDVNDVHDVAINGVFLDGDVAPGLFSGQLKTEGTFFDFLQILRVNDDLPVGANRTIVFNFDADASALNYLDAGDELHLIYEISATDSKGVTATAFVKVKVNGTEDKPILWVEDSGDVTEGDRGDDPITTTGILGIDGVDEDDRSTFLPNNDYDSGLVGTYGTLEIVVDENGLESFVYTLDNESDLVQSLNEGEIVQDTFGLAIFDNGKIQSKLDEFGNAELDEEGQPIPHLVYVTIDITGTDDEPVIVYEPAWVAEGDVGHPTFVEGFLTITDYDSNDNPTFATNPLQPGSGTGVGTYGEITGVVQLENPDFDPEDASSPEFIEVYTYVPNQELIQFLARGEELTDVVELTAYDYTLVDEHGNTIVRELATKAVDIVIKGTNDAPVVTSDEVDAWEADDKDAIGVSVTAEGTLTVSDIDLSDEVTIRALPPVGTIIRQEVTDRDGNVSLEEIPDWRLINAYDSVNSQLSGVNQDLLGFLSLPTGPVVAAGDSTGVVEWSFDSGLQGFDFLAKGEVLSLTYNVTVTDSYGETADATIVVNIEGKGDRPDIFVGEHDSASAILKEGSSAGFGNQGGFKDQGGFVDSVGFGGGILTGTNSGSEYQDSVGFFVSGTLSVSDVDASDSVTAFSGFGQGVVGVVVESTNPIPPDTGLTNADFLEMLSLLDATTVVGVGETEGTLEWEFATSEGFDFLAKGEQLTLTYTIQVSDKHAEDTQEVVIVIEGANDRPTVKNSLNFHSKGFRGDPANSIDANDFDNNGTLVSDLIRAQQEDVDVFGSLQGIAVQGVDFTFTTTGADSWEFSTDGGATWTAFDADLSAENATVLSTDARVRFVPDDGGENTGWAQLKFVLWDQTDGNPSGTTGVDSTELFVFKDDGETIHGESAFGQQMLWFTVEVTAPAADAPTAVSDNFEVAANSITTLPSVLANDLDPDTVNGDLTAALLGSPAGVTLFADGTFAFDSTGILPGSAVSFQYVVTDGTSSDVGTVTIAVAGAEVAIAGPEEVLVGKGGNIFTASTGSLGTIVSQQWSVDGVPVSTDASFDFEASGPGSFVLSYTATDSTGRVASGSVAVNAVSAAIVNGELLIGGTNSADTIRVNVDGSNYRVNVNGVLSEFAIADVTGDIVICGHDGDDDIRIAAGVTQSTQIFAGAGNDTVFGGNGSDTVEAGSGDDTVVGRGGNDFLFGDLGVDTLAGNGGNDSLLGGSEDDVLSGGTGDDTVDGQDGDDTVKGDAGDDVLLGGEGDDTLTGGLGDDEISGNGGDDTIFGTGGDDIISGGDGSDRIVGGIGDDVINAGDGDDVVFGNAGNDTIFGDGGNDTLSGGLQDDLIFGGSGDDEINGNAGNDTLDGQSGDDTLIGVQGDDTLTGGVGVDVLNGGAGIDTSIDVGETEILIEL